MVDSHLYGSGGPGIERWLNEIGGERQEGKRNAGGRTDDAGQLAWGSEKIPRADADWLAVLSAAPAFVVGTVASWQLRVAQAESQEVTVRVRRGCGEAGTLKEH